jgi:hypothetical protein
MRYDDAEIFEHVPAHPEVESNSCNQTLNDGIIRRLRNYMASRV